MIKTSNPAKAGPGNFITEENINKNKKVKTNIRWSLGFNVFLAGKTLYESLEIAKM